MQSRLTSRVIKAVLFDLDGTLLDSAPDLIATLNHLRASLGLKALPADDLRHFVSRGAVGLIKAGMPPCDDETLTLWREKFLSHYQENSFIQSRPFDGVELMLEELKDRGIPWGVVTNKMEFLSLPLLEKLGWQSSVSAVVCGDTVSSSKPDPEPVLAACKIIGTEPENTLMVGDDLRDVQAGKRAGCQTAFALYGYADKESQSEITDSTTLIRTPQEVLDILEAPGTV
jgi:2-phosphoglycolate phosphatase